MANIYGFINIKGNAYPKYIYENIEEIEISNIVKELKTRTEDIKVLKIGLVVIIENMGTKVKCTITELGYITVGIIDNFNNKCNIRVSEIKSIIE